MTAANSYGQLQIKTRDLVFVAEWELVKAPMTCAAIKKLLPITEKMVQARWSGEAAWISIDHLDFDVEFENHTIYPSKGELLAYPGFINVKEILVPYGASVFGSKMGLLPGNHFASIISGREQLEELGRRVSFEGAQDVEITELLS